MTDKELEEFIHHGETGFLAFAMMFGEGWAQRAIDIAKELRARLAQPEPEPVAWMHPERNTYTGAPAMSITPKEDWIPLYTSPPQREWQGLTDEEMFALWVKCPAETEDRFAFARAIEAKLKEKNCQS
jgi:hypothetical protein